LTSKKYSTRGDHTRTIELKFLKERHSRYELDKESTGEIIQRLPMRKKSEGPIRQPERGE
jgi:hypothetical protein